MAKYPKTLFITHENYGEKDSYFSADASATDALETTDGDTVAEYALVKVRTGALVPKWEGE